MRTVPFITCPQYTDILKEVKNVKRNIHDLPLSTTGIYTSVLSRSLAQLKDIWFSREDILLFSCRKKFRLCGLITVGEEKEKEWVKRPIMVSAHQHRNPIYCLWIITSHPTNSSYKHSLSKYKITLKLPLHSATIECRKYLFC